MVDTEPCASRKLSIECKPAGREFTHMFSLQSHARLSKRSPCLSFGQQTCYNAQSLQTSHLSGWRYRCWLMLAGGWCLSAFLAAAHDPAGNCCTHGKADCNPYERPCPCRNSCYFNAGKQLPHAAASRSTMQYQTQTECGCELDEAPPHTAITAC